MLHTSQSATTLHHFDSALKWKKRLINLSHKLQHRSNINHHWNAASTSATVMAAATEKFIRHSSPTTEEQRHRAPENPPEIEIHSEDLTASQFANLTGIKTKRNSSNSIYSGDMYVDSSDDEDDDDEDSHDLYYSTASVTSSNKCQQQQSVHIWDSHFWQDNRKSLPLPILQKATSIEPCSQPVTRRVSEPGCTRASAPCSLQKGRFKIVWGQEDNDEPVVKAEPHCVEWKRKRSGSNSSSTAI